MQPNRKNAQNAILSNVMFDKKVHITVHSIRRGRPDRDAVSIKAALDELVKMQVLKDDTTEEVANIDYTFENVKRGQEEKTIITIEEIE